MAMYVESLKISVPLNPVIILLAKILALCAPLPNRNTETVMQEKERVALLLLRPGKGGTQQLMPPELRPPPPLPLLSMESLCSQVVTFQSFFCKVSKGWAVDKTTVCAGSQVT